MDWKKIIPINQFKRYNNEFIDKYILITHREINIKLKRLSKIRCLYTSDKQYLLPEKFSNFKNSIIYNYLYFDNTLYRICSYGSRFSIYNMKKYINLDEIKNKSLYSICQHYKNHNQNTTALLVRNYNKYKSVNIYSINNDFSIWNECAYYTPQNILNILLIHINISIYIISLYVNNLIIRYMNGGFTIFFKNDIYTSNDIDVLSQYIYKKIDIKIDITLEYIKNIFYTIKSHQLIKTL